jgi:hypothetical protein
MESSHPVRVLVVSDHPEDAAVLDALRDRASRGPIDVRVVVPDPARAELHLLHPERHDKAAEAQRRLDATIPGIEVAAGGRVTGSVSVRHEPMDVIEDVVFNEPIDEIILALRLHGLSQRMHHDLPRRAAHLGLPITTVAMSAPALA